MYTPSKVSIYEYQSFAPPGPYVSAIDASTHGYPPEAVAVELLVGCRSWVDGAYVAAYDGLESGVGSIAVYPTTPMRNQWSFARGRVELAGSSFTLRIRPTGGDKIQVIVVLKGYYTA
ncbi:MAG TPA: hypothetical protein VJN32_02925 [Dehalococcoidia bacterium]|nr:hypothetical protein [Dehalococcoidia bacterium]